MSTATLAIGKEHPEVSENAMPYTLIHYLNSGSVLIQSWVLRTLWLLSMFGSDQPVC